MTHPVRAAPGPVALVGTVVLAASAATAPAALRAQTPYTEHTLHVDVGAPSPVRPALGLASLEWLSGQWQGDGLGAVAEEAWLPAAGGAMVGTFRLVDAGRVRFYELVTLVEEDGSLVMRLKHFHPDLVGWEERAERVEFPLLRADGETFWFDGLTMQRVAADELHVWVALEQSGKVQEALFAYRRVAPHSQR